MAKNAKKNSTTHGSQGRPSTNTTGQSAKKKTGSVVTRGPTSRSKLCDSTARTPTSQTLIASTWKRKSSELTAQRADKRQKTRPLTTEDIPTIVRAIRDALSESNGTTQGSLNLEDTQDTEGTVSTVSDESGMYSCLPIVCMYIPIYIPKFIPHSMLTRQPPPSLKPSTIVTYLLKSSVTRPTPLTSPVDATSRTPADNLHTTQICSLGFLLKRESHQYFTTWTIS